MREVTVIEITIFPNKRQCVFKATHRGRIKHLQVIFVINVSVL